MASTQAEEARRDALVERLFGATIGAFDLCAVYIGDRLGLYRALAEHGPASAGELASAAGIHERYALEWLEHQAVSGILDVSEAEDGVRRFVLPAGSCRGASGRGEPQLREPFRTAAGRLSPTNRRTPRCVPERRWRPLRRLRRGPP